MKTAIKWAAACGLVILLVKAAAAQSEALKTGYYTVDPAAITADRGGTLYFKAAGALYNSNATAECFSTGVDLPHRATITRIVVWYTGGNTLAPTIRFARNKLADDSVEEIASGELANTNAARKAQTLHLTASRAVVDNAQYSYGLDLCMAPDGARFYGARVTYTYLP
jgi:hypothetical protein